MTEFVDVFIHQLQAGDAILAIAIGLIVFWLLACIAVVLGRVQKFGGIDRIGSVAWQLGALLGLEQGYEFTRGQMPHNGDIALVHAYNVLDFEWRHGFFVEQRLERFFLQFPVLMGGVDLYYILSHAIVTVGVLAWICTRRPQHYPFARNMIVLVTAIALIAFYLYPTAPPRMLGNYGFVDPEKLYHFVSDGGAQPGSYTYNPYAAMPSLHVAYAIVIGWSAFNAVRALWVRILAVLYPFSMAAAVVISGNHWLLDVAGAVLTVALARLIIFVLSWMHVGAVASATRLFARPRAAVAPEGSS